MVEVEHCGPHSRRGLIAPLFFCERIADGFSVDLSDEGDDVLATELHPEGLGRSLGVRGFEHVGECVTVDAVDDAVEATQDRGVCDMGPSRGRHCLLPHRQKVVRSCDKRVGEIVGAGTE